jgi:putative transposase
MFVGCALAHLPWARRVLRGMPTWGSDFPDVAYFVALACWGMPRYRREHVPGGTFFFTVNLLERRRRLLVDHVDDLRVSFRLARHAQPFEVIAIVILPDHLHCLWRLPDGDGDNAGRWSRIKSGFCRRLAPVEYRSHVRVARRERGIWQRRFWEHPLRNEADLQRHVDYIHINPVKHGHAAAVRDWPYSSFHRYVRLGMLLTDWAGDRSGTSSPIELGGERTRSV